MMRSAREDSRYRKGRRIVSLDRKRRWKVSSHSKCYFLDRSEKASWRRCLTCRCGWCYCVVDATCSSTVAKSINPVHACCYLVGRSRDNCSPTCIDLRRTTLFSSHKDRNTSQSSLYRGLIDNSFCNWQWTTILIGRLPTEEG